jgi:hypothetical protein
MRLSRSLSLSARQLSHFTAIFIDYDISPLRHFGFHITTLIRHFDIIDAAHIISILIFVDIDTYILADDYIDISLTFH